MTEETTAFRQMPTTTSTTITTTTIPTTTTTTTTAVQTTTPMPTTTTSTTSSTTTTATTTTATTTATTTSPPAAPNPEDTTISSCLAEYLSEDSYNYLIRYDGDLEKELLPYDYACAYKFVENGFIVSVRKSRVNDFVQNFSQILTIELNYPYTLTDLQPVDTANITRFHSQDYLGLEGEGTLAVIIDTGIDYLNKQFINDDNTSRIRFIWDQSIQVKDPATTTEYGTIYTKDEINRAIAASLNGGDPYSIVPSRDENGHGTEMAGLVGARGLDEINGGAPKCEFGIIKLREITNSDLQSIGIMNRKDFPIFSTIDILLATRFIARYQSENQVPTAVLISCGTNLTSHQGLSTLEQYINSLSLRNGIVFVTNTGNQGDSSTHNSGIVTPAGKTANIEVNIGPNEKNFVATVWILKPNQFSISIVSPTGEVAEPVQPSIQVTQLQSIKLVLESSTISFTYNSYEATNGNEVVYINIDDPKPGVWQIRLTGNYVVDGHYDIWLPQRPIIDTDTKFVNADPYTTLMSPSLAQKAISTAFYNQNSNTIDINSGRGYPISTIIKPDLATGGVNAMTTGLNNQNVVISGGSVAGAVLCGAVLLTLEWGILRGNDKNMYSTSVISYLTRGTNKRPGDIYPNPQWGYGMLNLQGSFENLRHADYQGKTNNMRGPIASSVDNPSFIVYYSGDVETQFSNIPEAEIIIINPFIAIVFTTPEYATKIDSIPGIFVIAQYIPYILTETSPLSAANISGFSEGTPISLSGTGVIVALIDSGLDYLNREFMREDDTTRILSIWDQSDNSGTAPDNMGYGSEYSEEQINNAIKANAAGNNPYDIVPQRDTIGHGTRCAGIIGARGYNESIKGAAPDCDFVVVKLRPKTTFVIDPSNPSNTIPLYSNADLCTAVRYVLDYRQKVNKPMVVFIPLSSNYGSHNGNRPIEEIIDYFSILSNVIFAVGTGNQGNSQTHVSGTLKNTSDVNTIELQVGQNQNQLNVSIWINYPDKVSVGLISPTGQIIPRVPVKLVQSQSLKFTYEGTTANLTYFFPEVTSGNETISIDFVDLSPGLWKIQVYGDYIVNGTFNCWISQRPISRSGTLLLNSDNNTTLTIPSTSSYAIATSFYDQNTGNIAPTSGVGFTANDKIKPDISCGGVNVLTTNINNTTARITGSGAATAVLAGAIALIFQWGAVEKNLPNISSEIVRTILLRGASKRANNVYPNQYVGYGLLDLLASFDAIRGVYKNVPIAQPPSTFRGCDDKIETRIPIEIYKRLKPR